MAIVVPGIAILGTTNAEGKTQKNSCCLAISINECALSLKRLIGFQGDRREAVFLIQERRRSGYERQFPTRSVGVLLAAGLKARERQWF